MTLVSSGPISISEIANEIWPAGSYSLRDLSNYIGFSTPDAMSEFYGYTYIEYYYQGDFYYDNPCSGLFSLYTGTDGRWYKFDGYTYTDWTYNFVNSYGYNNGIDEVYYQYYLYEGPGMDYYGEFESLCSPY